MSRWQAALSLYVALALHLLLILLLVFGGGEQLPAGAGQGLGGGDAPASDDDAAPRNGAADAAASLTETANHHASSDALTLAARPIQTTPRPADAPSAAAETSVSDHAQSAPHSFSGSGAAGGGGGGYAAQVRAQLSRYRRSLPGVSARSCSVVAFRIAAQGAVSDVRLIQDSGLPELDQEALAIVHRAAPFAPPPDGPRQLSVPVCVDDSDSP